MGHIERKQREKDTIRQRILDTARSIVARDGWDAVTIRKIAQEIEYTPPIVYEHFENKGELLLEIIKSGFRELDKKFIQERVAVSDSKRLLIRLSIIHWNFAFENAKLYQIMFSLERQVQDPEMLTRFFEIKEIFKQFTGKSEDEVVEIIFNWMCLITGTISAFMKIKMPVSPDYCTICRDPKEIFVSFMERFLDSIEHSAISIQHNREAI